MKVSTYRFVCSTASILFGCGVLIDSRDVVAEQDFSDRIRHAVEFISYDLSEEEIRAAQADFKKRRHFDKSYFSCRPVKISIDTLESARPGQIIELSFNNFAPLYISYERTRDWQNGYRSWEGNIIDEKRSPVVLSYHPTTGEFSASIPIDKQFSWRIDHQGNSYVACKRDVSKMNLCGTGSNGG